MSLGIWYNLLKTASRLVYLTTIIDLYDRQSSFGLVITVQDCIQNSNDYSAWKMALLKKKNKNFTFSIQTEVYNMLQ